ncbi:MAG: N-acetylmuramic acid 6-phosphate etherase [Planctomycetota bacterium]|nr:N-acetylmuramic acid 6-phosphate etherase [Planctomycetota bacterium]
MSIGGRPARSDLPTERADAATAELGRLAREDAGAAFDLFLTADATIVAAVAAARAEVAAAVELVAARLAAGGRLFYVGAGTSGRLALLDAVECPPTFQSDPDQVQAVLAGGDAAFLRAVEGAEDDPEAAGIELSARGLCERDVVLGIAAGGTTPFVHGAIDAARSRGAASIFFACVPAARVPDRADLSIRVVTGPEVLAGSTRLKAGTATKLVLNALSTLVMARLGKVHQNRMVDVNTRSNAKLVERGRVLVAELADCDGVAAARLLEAAGGQVKLAVVMGALGLDVQQAQERLGAAGGYLDRALEA